VSTSVHDIMYFFTVTVQCTVYLFFININLFNYSFNCIHVVVFAFCCLCSFVCCVLFECGVLCCVLFECGVLFCVLCVVCYCSTTATGKILSTV
jgi:hypothetical protein